MKTMWLLFVALTAEMVGDEPQFSISLFEERAQCERSGVRIAIEFEANGGGAVMRNDDGTFCKPTQVTEE